VDYTRPDRPEVRPRRLFYEVATAIETDPADGGAV
jgi:hypothetical protein